MKIREPAVAGSFYPSDRDELKSRIRSFVENSRLLDLPNIKGLIVPHAGYIYSGPVAGEGYRQLLNMEYSKQIKKIPTRLKKIICHENYAYKEDFKNYLIETYE